MDLLKRWRIVVGLLAGPAGFLVFLRMNPSYDPAWFSPNGHLLVVGGIAGCALLVAIVAIVASVSTRQAGVVWMSVACSGVGLFMLGHGIATPMAIGQPVNQWVARFAYFGLLWFAAGLALAGLRSDRRIARAVARRPMATICLAMIPPTAFVAWIVVDPTRVHGAAPWRHESTILELLAVATIALQFIVIVRHARRWHLGHDPLQLALVLAATMSVAAVVAVEHGRFARLSWWDYHAYLLAAFGSTVWSVLHRRRRQSAMSAVLADLFVDDVLGHIVRGYPAALRELVHAVELKDAYTHGHSRRTAELAVELGIEMGLPADRLRVIARGAYLHDVGKIAIPDEILNKPGALTPDERTVIETHPRLGHELASNTPELREALPVILHHHERFDGGGYPAGLRGSDIPLEARVVAVADVWDALTSNRAYRGGWPPERALAHIEAGRGSHFDSRVVSALVRVAVRQGVAAPSAAGQAEVAWAAAQTCHELDRDVRAAA